MENLAFKIVKSNAHDEVIVRGSNYEICKAAFEKAVFVYPNDHLETGCEGHLEIEGELNAGEFVSLFQRACSPCNKRPVSRVSPRPMGSREQASLAQPA
jgi:hypothetical protein